MKYPLVTSVWQRAYNWIDRHWLVKKLYRGVLGTLQTLWLLGEIFWLFLYPKHRYVRKVNHVIRHHIAKHQSTFVFLKTMILHPKATGAVLPSSKRLAREMAQYIQLSEQGMVVELGAGTGVMTQAMLDRGIQEEKIIAIEYAPRLVKTLRKRFPTMHIIEGDAAQLDQLLKNMSVQIDAVISGLPLRSLPEAVSNNILAKIPQVLSKQGRYIQFTYDIRSGYSFYPPRYKPVDFKIIWRNIPPAKIDVFSCSTL